MSMLEIRKINLEIKARACVRPEIVEEYKQLNGQLPPITVWYDGSQYYLSDGIHRVTARKEDGKTDIDADIRQGTKHDAMLHAFRANEQHGLRRSPEDKRECVLTMLGEPEFSEASDRVIA